MAFDLGPGIAAIVRRVDGATGSAAEHGVGVHDHFPRARHHEVGIFGVEGKAGAAGVGIDEENALPGLPAIAGAEDAALFLGSGEAAGDAGVDDIGVGGMHDDAPDASALHEAHVFPCGAGIGGFIDAVALHIAIADGPRFAGAGPHRLRVGGRDGQRPDGLGRLIVEDGGPVGAAVSGFPNPARGRSHVVSGGVARNPGRRGNAVAHGRPHEAEGQAFGRREAATPAPLSPSRCCNEGEGKQAKRQRGGPKMHVYHEASLFPKKEFM